ncbi:hypothetical protein BDR03DRAFT_969620 [Suillus americanus]|nr:hypothetical protein BDR03DRAFT_969620 [Suillus americanus]
MLVEMWKRKGQITTQNSFPVISGCQLDLLWKEAGKRPYDRYMRSQFVTSPAFAKVSRRCVTENTRYQ